MHDITKIIEHIDRLKHIPKVDHRIVSISEDPHSSMADLAQVIRYEQVITANILKVAISSYFGLRRKVDTIQQATPIWGWIIFLPPSRHEFPPLPRILFGLLSITY